MALMGDIKIEQQKLALRMKNSGKLPNASRVGPDEANPTSLCDTFD